MGDSFCPRATLLLLLPPCRPPRTGRRLRGTRGDSLKISDPGVSTCASTSSSSSSSLPIFFFFFFLPLPLRQPARRPFLLQSAVFSEPCVDCNGKQTSDFAADPHWILALRPVLYVCACVCVLCVPAPVNCDHWFVHHLIWKPCVLWDIVTH